MRTNVCLFAVVEIQCGENRWMHHRYAPIAECERARERGEMVKLRQPGGKRPGRTRPIYRMVPQPEPSQSEYTPAAITAGDMHDYLGMGSVIDCLLARQKIDNYKNPVPCRSITA